MDLFLLAGALLLGFALRAYGLKELGLSHFDEGQYALAAWSLQQGHGFPSGQGFFSPPLYPALVSLGMLLFGPRETVLLGINVLAGTGIIGAGWWLGRLWWGPATGNVAAWTLAANPMQIEFSRTGLTDPLLTLLVLLAVGMGWKALRKGGWERCLLAGGLIALAWNTKYNGWLPVLLLAPSLLQVRQRVQVARIGLIALIAGIGYLPWATWFHVEHPGGYFELIQHQRGYWIGPSGILPGISAYFALIHQHASWLLPAIWIFAASACATTVAQLTLLAAILTLAQFLAPVSAILLLGSIGVLQARGPVPAWSAFILVILPAMYTPYLRLWLPGDAILAIASAAGWVFFAKHFPWQCRLLPHEAWQTPIPWRTAVTVLAAYSFALATASLHRPPPWPTTSVGYREAIARVAPMLEGRRAAAYVSPPVLFYLSQMVEKGEIRRLPAPPDSPPRDMDVLLLDSALGVQLRNIPGWTVVRIPFQPSYAAELDQRLTGRPVPRPMLEVWTRLQTRPLTPETRPDSPRPPVRQ